ncbi:MAG TPA: DEAD/DEAH box helicase [Syntrophomonadaceae bacterium]|nr:DEAD/DEAH box helicase [Syntrophomonadaceae bacterium]
MSLDPLKATAAIKEKYLDYLETTFALNDRELHQKLVDELKEPGRFSKGPILEATPPFETGRSLLDLIKEGLLSQEFTRLKVNELPLERELYIHQEEAIRKLVQDRRNIIVATGTGSGKTETFLLPILNYLFRQKEKGQLNPGVRALLLYPMNALANDQLKRLRKLLKNYPDITFGSYTGETEQYENQAIQKFKKVNPREEILPNELLSRAKMHQAPPHILLSNYAMLEYLLLRPDDNVFFDGRFAREWRFFVIDEAHTYSGAKGIEMAMLLRRLKDRVVKSKLGAVQCVGTSATLGGDKKDFARVAQFGSGLFGEPFEWDDQDPGRQDVISGSKKKLAVADRSWGSPGAELYIKWEALIQNGEVDISDLIRTGRELGVPPEILQHAEKGSSGYWARFLHLVLSGDKRVITLQNMLEQAPCYLQDVVEKLFKKDGERYLVALVYVANKARLAENDQPLLPARYHLFIRALEGGYCTLLPKKQLFLERRERVEVDGKTYAVFETAVCRQCSSLYLVGELNEQNILKQPGKRFYEDPNKLEYYLVLENREPLPDNEDELTAGVAEYPGGERYRLCARCGANNPESYVDLPCRCGEQYLVPVLLVRSKDGNVHKCPACGSVISIGSVVRRLVLGAEAVTSVLGTAIYQQIPETNEDLEDIEVADDDWASPGVNQAPKSNRRLLIFSDSRQDAAFFATYLESSYNQILRRRLIINTLEKYQEKVIGNRWRLRDLAEYVKRLLVDLSLYPKLSGQALEDEAWKWVLFEFMANDRNIGLEGQGLLGFVPVQPPGWEPPPALCRPPWKLTGREAVSLMNVLLDTIRRNGAILYPDTVVPTDPFFSPRNREYYFSEFAPVQGRILSWLPVREKGVNTRLDYLLRIPSGTGAAAFREEALTLLKEIWNILIAGQDSRAAWKDHFYSFTDGKNGLVFGLRPDYWELRPAIIDPRVKWYRCTKCKRLTLHNIRDVCPTFCCEGKLVECDPAKDLSGNHYSKLYTNTLPLAMTAHEHTAQLTTGKAAEIQELFTEGEVNILSCSTTFELGVDVGELETVFMRNVPPTAANYIQRAGRAGRRTSSTAFVLTFAQRRSHDFAHYKDPLKIIKGEIKPPYIEIANDKIIRRHMYAVALAMFWTKHPGYFGLVNRFFPSSGETATRVLQSYLMKRPPELENSLKRIIPKEMWTGLGVEDWQWVPGLLDEHDGVLTKAEIQLFSDIKELKQIEEDYSKSGDYPRARAVQKTIKTIEKRYLLSFLSQRNVIPKYGFPVDVVELQINHHGEEAKGLELDRDLKIALSEYAPGSQIVAGGKLWTSRYIKKLPDREPLRYSYAICSYCGLYRSELADKEVDLNICLCGENVGRNKGEFITPEFGFIAGKPEKPKMSRPEKTYSTRKYFAREGHVEKELTLHLSTTVKLQAGGDGKLAVINSAGARGFKICQSCGYAEIFDGKPLPKHQTPWGRSCQGRYNRYSLGYEFNTDILQVRFPDYTDTREGFWESLLYGLLEGACMALDIDRQDIDGTLYPYAGDPFSPALILFDDVPGGAGHVKKIAEQDNFTTALGKALEIVARCECDVEQEDTSCYLCLRSYTNQYCHHQLNRGYVKRFLEQLLAK